MHKWIRLCIAGAIGVSLSGIAMAEETSTLSVSARSVAICSVSSASLAFGDYRGAILNSSGTIEVSCTEGVPYVVGLGAGLNPTGGNTGTRQMRFGSDLMPYQLYLDASLGQIWGDDCASAGTLAGFPCKTLYNGDGDGTAGEMIAGTGLSEIHTVYGEIPANLSVRQGTFSDSVVVTFVF